MPGTKVAEASRVAVEAALSRRREERRRLLELGKRLADRLPATLDVQCVVVVGSVARGDFNVWSDVDVLVVAASLPDRPQDRLSALGAAAPTGVSPIGWTPAELRRELARGNPLAREAVTDGVVLRGAERLRQIARAIPE